MSWNWCTRLSRDILAETLLKQCKIPKSEHCHASQDMGWSMGMACCACFPASGCISFPRPLKPCMKDFSTLSPLYSISSSISNSFQEVLCWALSSYFTGFFGRSCHFFLCRRWDVSKSNVLRQDQPLFLQCHISQILCHIRLPINAGKLHFPYRELNNQGCR